MPLDGDLEKTLREVTTSLKETSDKVKAQAEATERELKAFGKIGEETKATADELLTKQSELSARVLEVEQKLAGGGERGSGPEVQKSGGELFADNEDVRAFMARKARGSVTVSMPRKAIITSATANADGSAGALVNPQRLPGILPIPTMRLTVRDLIAPGSTTSNAIEYVQETGFTNNAASVAEGALKPESDIKFNLVTTTVTTIAHTVRASKQILDDAAQLRSYVDARLRWGLKDEEEAQLLLGAGTGGDLHGIYPQATAYAAPLTIAGATRVDQLRLMMLQASLAEFPPTGIVLHTTDFTAMTLQKDSQGRYLFGDPQGVTTPRLWGLPIVETTRMALGTALVGSFAIGAQIFDREQINVEISTEDRDNFVRNLVTLRCEERLGLAVFRPQAFVKATLIALPA
jgi:HK97 family phage major capsid protein